MKSFVTAFLAVSLFQTTAFAQQPAPGYFDFGKPELTEIVDTDFIGLWKWDLLNQLRTSPTLPFVAAVAPIGGTSPQGDVTVDEIIAIGKLVWNIIEKNQPKVDTQANRLSVLPKASKDWTDLERWSNPESRVFQLTYTNGFKMEVVRFSFRVIYVYGGRYNGKGKYLANVSVIPMDTHVAWGYTLNSNVEFPTIVNVGTASDPIVATQLDVRWQVETVVKKTRESSSYFVRGDGQLIDLSNGF